jgi:hypothetical protein
LKNAAGGEKIWPATEPQFWNWIEEMFQFFGNKIGMSKWNEYILKKKWNYDLILPQWEATTMSEIKEKPVTINELHFKTMVLQFWNWKIVKTSSAVKLTMSTNWHCKVWMFWQDNDDVHPKMNNWAIFF